MSTWVIMLVAALALVAVIPHYLMYRAGKTRDSSGAVLRMSEEDLRKIGMHRPGQPVAHRHDGGRVIPCAGLCRREILTGQYYWEIPLHGLGQSYYICYSCCPDERTILDVQ